ncbi:MAG: hypothetical protein IKM28_04780 [Lachnospiraceae bacterium]|nr:hypothetical protein [Lachnospiraceae bacterium]
MGDRKKTKQGYKQIRKLGNEKKDQVGGLSVSELLYYLFFAVLFFAKGIGLYDGQEMFKVFLLVGMVCFAGKLLLTEYTVKELLLIGVLCLAAGFSYLHTREKGILFTVMIMIGLKNIPVHRLCRVALGVWCLSYVPAVILTTLRLIDSPFRVHVRPGVGFIIRWAMGSAHPNVAHIGYLVLVMLIVYVLGERISWKWILLLFGGNCFVYFYTVSQTGMLMTTFYLIATVYLMYRKQPSLLEYGLVEGVLPVCMVCSLVLPLVLQGRAFDIVNKLMNTRLMQSRRYLTNEKITLLGSGMQMTDATTTMDNSFVFAFMTYGMITFGLLMLAYFLLIRRCIREKKHREIAIIVTLLIAGLSEPFLFNTSFKNLSLIFMGTVLFAGGEIKGSFWARTVSVPELLGQEQMTKITLHQRVESKKKKLVQKEGRKKYRAALVIGALLGALLWGGGYRYITEVPFRTAVPRYLCDSVELPSVFLSSGQILENGEVLGYVDNTTEMVIFEGDLSQYEAVRGILCRAVYGGCLGLVVVFLGYSMVKYKNRQ